MQVVSLFMLALQTVCCPNFYYFFKVQNALLEWALTCNTKIYVMAVFMKVALQIAKKSSRRQNICSKND